MIRLAIIIALLLYMGSSAFAQVNYVPNGDFETYSKCPDGTGVDQIWDATGWTPIDSATRHPDGRGNVNCSAEYCNECAPKTALYATLPDNPHFYQYAHSGKGAIGVFMYVDYDTSKGGPYYPRDYIQSKLTKRLIAGRRYCVTLYVNLLEISDYAIKEVSAYLDNGSIDATPFCGLPQSQYTPQVTNSGGPITDTAGWTKIEGSFIATGNEYFITIGNFKDKTGTTAVAMPVNRYNGGSHTTYYLVDDVSVIESTTVANAGPDTHVGYGDSVYIGRPPSEVIWCNWRVLGDSTVIGRGPGIWVKPVVNTSYVVTQTLCGYTTTDTVNVEVWPAGIRSINGQTQQYAIVPNPNSGRFEIMQHVSFDESADVTISDMLGRKVWSGQVSFREGRASFDCGAGWPMGMYYLSLRDSKGNIAALSYAMQ